jgi:hypothetical protein
VWFFIKYSKYNDRVLLPEVSINVQCVHKVRSGFWKIVARKQIELATCGLRQIIEKLWKIFAANIWHKRPSLRFSVSCLWNGECAGRRALCGMALWDKISHPDSTKGSPQRGLLRSVKNFQSFTVICRKPHVASSICLSATIFQNPKETLWTHCSKI